MAEHYRFFNSTEGDIREYQAADFAEYFSRFISDGVFSEGGSLGLKVTTSGGLGVSVSPGYAFIKGYMYHNDSALSLTLDNADATLDRIDRIVLRFDEVNRTINLAVKKGALASTPTAPSLTNTTALKELSLAQIRVRKGSSSIGSITDERLTEYCGQVSMLIDVPVADMWDIYNHTLDEIETEWEDQKNEIGGEWQDQNQAIDSEWDIIKSNFNSWFESRQQSVGVEVYTGKTEPANIVAGDIWLREVD